MALVPYNPTAKQLWLIGVTVDEQKLFDACLAFHIAQPAMKALDMIARRREAGKLFCLKLGENNRSDPYSKEDLRHRELRRETPASIAHLPGEILSQIRLSTYRQSLFLLPSFRDLKQWWGISMYEAHPIYWIRGNKLSQHIHSMTPVQIIQGCLEHYGFMVMFDMDGNVCREPSWPSCTITSRPFRSWEKFGEVPLPGEELKGRFRRLMDALMLHPINSDRMVPTAINVTQVAH
jgi:hypothetical protein